jgi:hypothetical protein
MKVTRIKRYRQHMRARNDDRMVAFVCPRCHKVRYFPLWTALEEKQEDGSRRRRVCDQCS